MKRYAKLLTFCGFVLLISFTTPAQKVFEGSQQGLPPFGSFHGSNFDTVLLQNGNLHIEIPVLSVPQRNGRAFTYRFILDTHTYSIDWIPNPEWPQSQPKGWWVVDYGSTGDEFRLTHPFFHSAGYTMRGKLCGTNPGISYAIKSNFQITDPDGTQHQVGYREVTPPVTCLSSSPSAWSPALDGAGMILNVGLPTTVGTVYLRDGTKIVPGSSTVFTDSNGNQSQSTALHQTTDMLQRDLLTKVSGSNFEEWTIRDSGGNSQVSRVDYIWINIRTSMCTIAPLAGGPCIEFEGQVQRPEKLTLPNGKLYQFHWAEAIGQGTGHGELTSIDLPTGGSISYTYTSLRFKPTGSTQFASHSARRAVATRTPSLGGTWFYTLMSEAGDRIVKDPAGNEQVHTFSYLCTNNQTSSSKHETQVKFYIGTAATGTLLKTILKDYAVELAPDDDGNPRCDANVRVIRETTKLNDTNQWSKLETDYETFTYWGGTYIATRLNVTERREYNWGIGAAGPLARKTTYSYLHAGNSNYISRNIVGKVVTTSIYDGGGALKAQTTNEYDGYTTNGGEGIEAANAVQHDGTNYGTGFIYRANITAVKRWRNTDGTWLETRNLKFDSAGNILKIRDPGGHITTFNYDNAWHQTSCAPAGNARSYPKSSTNALGHVTGFSYYSCTGFIASGTDPNNRTATFTYDFMNRPDVTNLPGGGQVDFDYDDTARWVRSKTLRAAGAYIVKYTRFDQLGRPFRTELCEDGTDSCAAGIKTDTQFDNLGRTWRVSNPYRSGETIFWTETQYDALSRINKIIPTDGSGSSNNVTTTYDGNTLTVTDQAGKKRKSEIDALGRLIRVWEPDATQALVHVTRYQYDTLDNLLCVHQKSIDATADKACTDATVPTAWRPRVFTYNSLSQLLSANNPESGLICYGTMAVGVCQNNGYDGDGNVLMKTSFAPNQTGSATVTTCYGTWQNGVCQTNGTNNGYDDLHRLIKKTYSDGVTPSVTYGYDGAAPAGCSPTLSIANGIGRRTVMCDSHGFSAWTYDEIGNVMAEERKTATVTKTVNYDYNEDNSLRFIQYPTPSPTKIDYSYDNAGRLTEAKDIAASLNYAIDAKYSAAGALCSLKNGSNLTSTITFNNRLQPSRVHITSNTPPWNPCDSPTQNGNVLDFIYAFNHGITNNGNVSQIANNITPDRTQNFTYDELNRIKTGATQAATGQHAWGLSFGYDIWANLLSATVTQGNPPPLAVGVSDKNRINTVQNLSYDAPGNLTYDPPNLATFTYDAENRMFGTSGTLGNVAYVYDGDGRRVGKDIGNNGTIDRIYWYGMSAEAIAETDGAGNNIDEHIFFGGKRIARRGSSGDVFFYLTDHLGTSRVLIQSGQSTPCYDADYYPFGGERVVTNTCTQNYKFTGKERDSESNLDYFIARYYGELLGRFLSADPLYFQVEMTADPQMLNRYTYARNNPLAFIDPTGEAIKLSDNPLERERELAALCQASGLSQSQCKNYLYANKVQTGVDKDGKPTYSYFVGIFTNGADGTSTAFEDLNPAARAVASIIHDPQIVAIAILRPDETFRELGGQTVVVGPIDPARPTSRIPGGIGYRNGILTAFILDPRVNPGQLPAILMSNSKPGVLTTGIILGHELGGILSEIKRRGSHASESLDLENKVRRLKDPNAPIRQLHNIPVIQPE